MIDKKDPQHGGKRPGAGRPKTPPSVLLRIKVSPEKDRAIKKRGGAVWLHRVIDEALNK